MSQSSDYHKQTVAELRAELSSRGLDDKGKKAELVERLVQHDEENAADEAAEVEGEEIVEEEEGGEDGEDGEEYGEGDEQEETLDYIEMEEEQSELMVDEEELGDEAGDSKAEDLEMDTEDGDVKEAQDDVEVKEEEDESKMEDQNAAAEENATVKEEPKDAKSQTNGEQDDGKMEDDAQVKEEVKDEVEINPLTEDDIKKLEDEAAAAHEERQKDFRKRLIFRVGKNAVSRFLDESALKKYVLISPFEFVHMENSVVSECMKSAQGINMQTSEVKGEFGWLELKFKNNKDAMEAKEKLSAAFKGLDIKSLDSDHIKSVTTYWEQRSVRGAEYNEKFRSCLLLAVLELKTDEVETVKNDEIEDAIRPSFPGALNVAIPPNCEAFESRFILVEYATGDQASAALEASKTKDIAFGDYKLSFDVYQKAWTEEKVKYKAEIDKKIKEDPILANKKGKPQGGNFRKGPAKNVAVIPTGEPMEAEERKALGVRIFSLYKSLEQLDKSTMENKDARVKLLKTELEKLRTKMRADDLRRKGAKLPHLPWNPNAKHDPNKKQKRPKQATPKKAGGQTPGMKKKGPTPQRPGQKRQRTNSASRDQPPQKQFRQGGGFQQRSPQFQNKRPFGRQAFQQNKPGMVQDLRNQLTPKPQQNRGAQQKQFNKPFNKKDGRKVQVNSNSSMLRVNIQQQQQQQPLMSAAVGSYQQQQQQQQRGRQKSRGGRGMGLQSRSPSGGGGNYSRGFQTMGPTRTISNNNMGGGMSNNMGGGRANNMGGRANSRSNMGGMRQQSMGGGYGASSGGNRSSMGGGGMGGGSGGMGSNSGGGLDTTNPVQLLLGLSKVLSSQIKQMDGGSSGGVGGGGGGDQFSQQQQSSYSQDSYQQDDFTGGYGSNRQQQQQSSYNNNSNYSTNSTDNYGGGYGSNSSYGNDGGYNGGYGGSGYY